MTYHSFTSLFLRFLILLEFMSPDVTKAQQGTGLHFFAPTEHGGWQDGEAGAACGELLRRTCVAWNVFGMGDAERAYCVRVDHHLAALNRLRSMFPNVEGFFSGGIWSYTPEQLRQAGVIIVTSPCKYYKIVNP